ncbi:hypothetical protein [Fulvimarina endophytica]|nr:hypothetical protein [Fulvimarina endophytica]
MPDMPGFVDQLSGTSSRSKFEPTVSAALTQGEEQAQRIALTRELPPGWALTILRTNSGSDRRGRIQTCGLYSAASSDGSQKRSGIFRSEIDRSGDAVYLRSLAETGTQKLIVYSNCQKLGLF